VDGRSVPTEGEPAADQVALFADGHLVGVAERVGAVLKPRAVVAE